MQKIAYTREQVQAAYDELKRRVNLEVNEYPELYDDQDMPEADYFEMVRLMTNGLYSAFMVTATNWPEIVQWIPEEETKRALRLE